MPRLTFRDGDRDVVDHVAELLRTVETYKLTYEQAMVAANNQLLQQHVGKRMNDVVSEHMRQFKG